MPTTFIKGSTIDKDTFAITCHYGGNTSYSRSLYPTLARQALKFARSYYPHAKQIDGNIIPEITENIDPYTLSITKIYKITK